MKNILKILLMLVLFLFTDIIVGSTFNMMYRRSRYGIMGRQVYALDHFNHDILILGSSRAAHHYVPEIIEENTGYSCYNAGSDGMCVFYHYSILSHIVEMSKPKLVILDVSQSDIEYIESGSFSLSAAIDRLKPEYKKVDAVGGLLKEKGLLEQICMFSSMYRYNSQFIQIISANILSSTALYNGYEPLYGISKPLEQKESSFKSVDLLKVKYLKKILSLCSEENIPIIVVYSPTNNKPSKVVIDNINSVIGSFSIPLNIFFDKNKNEYNFIDETHLNHEGAVTFTKDIVEVINKKV